MISIDVTTMYDASCISYDTPFTVCKFAGVRIETASIQLLQSSRSCTEHVFGEP